MTLDARYSIEYKNVNTRIKEFIDNLERLDNMSTNDKNTFKTFSFSANKKWLSLPKDIREILERNVWCGNCGDVVRIENYTVEENGDTLCLKGKCAQCGKAVARVIED